MKQFLIVVGRTLLCGLLLCASIFLFMVAVVTIDDQPWVWLASCIGCIVTFIGAAAISLHAIEHKPESAPKAQTRSEYEPETRTLKTA